MTGKTLGLIKSVRSRHGNLYIMRYQSSTPTNNTPKHLRPPPKFVNKKPDAKLLNSRLKEKQDIRKERNKLALSSLKDIMSIFNPNADTDDFDLDNFDTTPYYQNPSLFHDLPFYKQQFIIDELKEKMKKKWTGMNKDMKRFSVWLAYSSYGPREGFPNLYDYYTSSTTSSSVSVSSSLPSTTQLKTHETSNTNFSSFIDKAISEHNESTTPQPFKKESKNQTPIDLPFILPSIVASLNPASKTPIHKIPTRDPRSFGALRMQQYKNDRRMNPYNKIVILILVFLTVLNFKKDRKVNNTGIVPEYPWEKEKREEQEKLEHELLSEKLKKEFLIQVKENDEKAKKTDRKWYYLYLW